MRRHAEAQGQRAHLEVYLCSIRIVITVYGEKFMARSAARIGLRGIVCHFEELKEARSTINRLYPLPGVVRVEELK